LFCVPAQKTGGLLLRRRGQRRVEQQPIETLSDRLDVPQRGPVLGRQVELAVATAPTEQGEEEHDEEHQREQGEARRGAAALVDRPRVRAKRTVWSLDAQDSLAAPPPARGHRSAEGQQASTGGRGRP
jgi:hypothetical protein